MGNIISFLSSIPVFVFLVPVLVILVILLVLVNYKSKEGVVLPVVTPEPTTTIPTKESGPEVVSQEIPSAISSGNVEMKEVSQVVPNVVQEVVVPTPPLSESAILQNVSVVNLDQPASDSKVEVVAPIVEEKPQAVPVIQATAVLTPSTPSSEKIEKVTQEAVKVNPIIV